MSHNLQITIDGEHIDVRQTPSHITFMCMMSPTGWTIHLKGKKAKQAARAYLAWVQHIYPESKEEQLWDALKTGKEVEVYVV